jgi:hypothetical protein
MAVIFREYGDSNLSTIPSRTSDSVLDPNQILVSRFTSTNMDFEIPNNGLIYKFAFTGQFTSALPGYIPSTLAEISSLDGVIFKDELFQGDSLLSSRTYSPGIDIDDFDAFDNQILEGLQRTLAGDDVYYNSSGADFAEGSNNYFLFGGNDTLYQNHPLLQYVDVFRGGDGIDTAVMPGVLTDYIIEEGDFVWDILTYTANLPGYVVWHPMGAVNALQLNEVERLSFTDTMLALDTGANENAGNSYLLYQAAFDRIPDVEGLGYWISKVDGGANIVRDVAQNFILSNEFKSLYGSNPSVPEFMGLLYQNVLNRTPDAEGLKYWLDEFAQAGDSTLYRAGLLNNFAISVENIANVASQIVDGIQYQAYVG